MLTIQETCDQYAWLYHNYNPPEAWDHVFPVDGAYAAIKSVGDTDYLMFRGSTTFLDWIEDFQDGAIPYTDHDLGPVHPGARSGVLQVKPSIDKTLRRKYVICGHSLGALHAAIYSGYKSVEGNPPQSVILWGEPRSGGPKLHDLVNTSKTYVYSYRNQDTDGHDLVTDVPFDIPEIAPYRHVSDGFIPVTHSPLPDDIWLAFRYHHFGLYARALGATSIQALSLPLKN